MIFHPVEEAVQGRLSGDVTPPPARVSTSSLSYWQLGGRCHSSWFRRLTLPDGIVDCVSVSSTNAANLSPHSCIFRNFPLIQRRQEDRRLVHVLHDDLERRPVCELLQSQKPSVHVIVHCLCRHYKTSLSLIVQSLRRKETPFKVSQ